MPQSSYISLVHLLIHSPRWQFHTSSFIWKPQCLLLILDCWLLFSTLLKNKSREKGSSADSHHHIFPPTRICLPTLKNSHIPDLSQYFHLCIMFHPLAHPTHNAAGILPVISYTILFPSQQDYFHQHTNMPVFFILKKITFFTPLSLRVPAP